MAFQSRKSSQTDEKDVGIESDEHSSSWETLRFQENSPSPLKFDESKDEGKIYFKTPERKVNRKLSFLETGIDTRKSQKILHFKINFVLNYQLFLQLHFMGSLL